MQKQPIQTEQAPQAIGPYAQAQLVDSFLYTSGQIPLTKEGELVQGGIHEQTHQVLHNLQAVLRAGGATFDDVVKVTLYIKDMDQFSTINSIYEQYLGQSSPARSCVEVARLPKDVLIEIECIALVSKK